jgi:hypothetical protein
VRGESRGGARRDSPARMDSYLRIVGAEPDDVDDDADEGDGD